MICACGCGGTWKDIKCIIIHALSQIEQLEVYNESSDCSMSTVFRSGLERKSASFSRIH